jgi:ABC-type phosphate/phosphonate transport system substrate-binding protein
VYFAELVVRADSAYQTIADLAGARATFNDPCSLSGYGSLLAGLRAAGHGPALFGSMQTCGSHDAAIAWVADGRADVAVLDANVLRRVGRQAPDMVARLRVLHRWGPFPMQPVVIRAALAPTLGPRLSRVLLELHEHVDLRRFGFSRFAPVRPEDYDAVVPILDAISRHQRT